MPIGFHFGLIACWFLRVVQAFLFAPFRPSASCNILNLNELWVLEEKSFLIFLRLKLVPAFVTGIKQMRLGLNGFQAQQKHILFILQVIVFWGGW